MNRIQPGSEVTWRLSGLIKNGLKDYYGAIIDFTRCIKMDSFDIEILNARAIARWKSKISRVPTTISICLY